VQQRCEALGLVLTPSELERVYHAVITLGENRKAVGDGDLRRIVERVRTAPNAASGSTSSNVVAGYISN
jgi:hypothetical protein